MTRLPDPQLAQKWQKRLERFAKSDLTIAEFCQLDGYSQASFYQWRRKLADDDTPSTPRFVPVELEANDLREHPPVSIHVDLPGGAKVNLPAGVALADCRNLIAAIVDVTATCRNTLAQKVTS